MKLTTLAAALSLSISNVSGHYIFQQLSVGSQKFGVYEHIRKNSNYNSPVTSLSSNDLRCNVGGNSGSGTSVLSVKAGDSFTFTSDTAVYHQGPTSLCVGPAFSFNRGIRADALPQVHVQSPRLGQGLRRIRRLVQDLRLGPDL
jgi:hypothetical protein